MMFCVHYRLTLTNCFHLIRCLSQLHRLQLCLTKSIGLVYLSSYSLCWMSVRVIVDEEFLAQLRADVYPIFYLSQFFQEGEGEDVYDYPN